MLYKFLQYMLGNGITLVIGVITTPILTRLISTEEMGKHSFFVTVVSFLTLFLCVGMDQVYVRFYYDNGEKNKTYLYRCMYIPMAVTTAANVLFLLFYRQVSEYIVGEQSLVLVLLLSVYNYWTIIERFSMTQIRMRQKAKKYSALNVFGKASYLVLALLFFVNWGDRYWTLAMATVLSNILLCVLAIVTEKDVWFAKGKRACDIGYDQMLKYGVPLIFSSIITMLFQYMDKIMLKRFSTYSEIGIYAGAMTFISLLNAVQGGFTSFWVPVAYEKHKAEPTNKEFFKKANEIASFVMLLIAILLIGLKDIIILLLGNDYRSAVFVFPFLVFMPVMYTVSETTVMGINFANETKCHIWIALSSMLTNAVGNYILIPLYGARGAAISTGLSYIVFFGVRTWLSHRLFPVGYTVGKFAVGAILTYILAIYASFHAFDGILLLLVLLALGVLMLLYRETVKMAVTVGKNYLGKRR